jgi:3-hydroxy-3-methylglutaryl CoA synthase
VSPRPPGPTTPVGIDDLNLYASTLSVDNALVAEARGTSRYMDIVRIRRRSIAPLCEDPVTLAVNAARPIVDAAGPDAFELLIVATESGFDYGKPLSSYVHRHLGLGSRCRNLEAKHACYGGTASLQLACAWVRSEAAPGKKALVVTTDLPGNQFGQPAELTPGTGAVALSVSAEPRVLALDLASGYAAREVYDTARPTATGHWVDEVLSLGAYLDLLELAYGHYRSRRGEVPLEEDLDYLVYHMPLESLVRKAHEVLLAESAARADGNGGGAGRSFDRMVAPSLRYCAETGNIFSGTLYAGLAALVDSDPPPRPGARVGMYSYGSGSCAEFFAGTLGHAARSVVGARRIGKHLEARRPLSVPDYERIVLERESKALCPDFTPERETPAGHFEEAYRGSGLLVLEGVKDYYRRYARS